jgi:hypothetical protein
MSRSNFYPVQPPSNLSVSSTSARLKLSDNFPQLDITARLVNTGSKIVYVAFGDAEVTASDTTGIAILSGAIPPELLNIPENTTHMAYATASGDTGTLQITLGRMGK